MKTPVTLLLLAVLSPAALYLAGCNKSKTESTTTATKAAVADVKTATLGSWDNVKDYTFEKRADFATKVERMATDRETYLSQMNAKVAGLPGEQAKMRDRAMKDFSEAQAELAAQLVVLRASTAETWVAAKEKTGVAWTKLQASYAGLSADVAK